MLKSGSVCNSRRLSDKEGACLADGSTLVFEHMMSDL